MWGDFQSTTSGSGSLDFGQDTFAFSPDNGTDYIYDFQQGEDKVELAGFYTVSIPEQVSDHASAKAQEKLSSNHKMSFEDLDMQTVDTNGDGTADSSHIRFDDVNSVTVYNNTSLTSSDFDFLA